jgi:hypothetical protein
MNCVKVTVTEKVNMRREMITIVTIRWLIID